MSMLCRPMWLFLLMYESHDMRHMSFLQVDCGQRDPQKMGRHKILFLFLETEFIMFLFLHITN